MENLEKLENPNLVRENKKVKENLCPLSDKMWGYKCDVLPASLADYFYPHFFALVV